MLREALPMVCCPQCEGIEREFDRTTARRDLRRYRRRGPLRSTRILLHALRAEGVGGKSLLDIGGGVGAIHHELLHQGAASATHVDASSAYLAAAREEAARRGHDGRIRFVHGDFVALAPELGAADIVTLDRVICCYPDMERLVGLSAARATELYGLVFPRESWWMRPIYPVSNLYFRARRCPFRLHFHPTRAVDGVVRAQGFRPLLLRQTLMWQVLLYRRDQKQPVGMSSGS